MFGFASDTVTLKTCITVVRDMIFIDAKILDREVLFVSRAIVLCHGAHQVLV